MTAKSHLSPDRIQLLQELAHTYGTPLYVYDMEQIKRNFLSFKQAFNARKSLICYALKANSNLSVLRLLAELGSGADCVSIGEVKRALLAGIPKYKIIFSGVGKKDDEIKEALELGILFINVESCVSIGEVKRALLAGIPKYKIIFSGVGKKDDEIKEALELGILFINVESFEELKRVEAIAKSLADSACSDRVGFLAKNGDCGGESALITTQGKSLDSPCKAPFLAQKSCREQTALESTFSQSPTANKKVDSSTATTLSEPAKDSRIFTQDAASVSEPQSAKTESAFDNHATGGRIFLKKHRLSASGIPCFDEKVGLCSGEQGDKTCGLSRELATNSPLFRKKPTPETQKARISIRVNPNIDAKTHPYISTGLHENKFGVDMESAKQMYLYAHKSAFLEPVGIHFHIGSQLTDLEPLTQAARKIADLARSLLALGVNLRFFDIGGGLGIRYEDEKPIDLYSYAQGILSTLSGCDWTIICEPGRRIVGDSGLLLTQVISQKLTESKRFVIVDAGMNDLVRPALYGAYHQPIILQNSACSDRVGFLAKNGDCGGDSALITTQGKSLESPCKAPFLAQKSCREDIALESTFSQSPTAILRILEEDNQGGLEKSSLSSLRADEIGVAIHKNNAQKTQNLESTFETSANSQAQSVASLEKVDSSTATTLSEPAKDSRIFNAQKTQNLESTFETSANSQAQSVASLEKVDSSTATTLSEPAKDSRIFTQDAASVSEPHNEKTESVFDNHAAGGRIFDEKVGLCSGEQGDKTCGLSTQRATNSPLFRKKPTPETQKAESPSTADIVGPVCESSDTFCKNIALPPLHNGALLGFSNAGAYGYSMASTYNARMRPAEVGIYADGARLIKPRESLHNGALLGFSNAGAYGYSMASTYNARMRPAEVGIYADGARLIKPRESFEASVADELALLDSSK